MIVGGVIIVVLAVVSFGILQLVAGINDKKDVSPEEKKITEQSVKRAKEDGELQTKAKEEIKNNDVIKAGEVYQEIVDRTDEVNRKIELYVDLANVYYDSGKTKEAIEAAKKAEALSSDRFLAADWLSRAYEDQKEYANALKYYVIARDSVASVQNEYQFDKAYYDGEIARVTKLQGSK